MSSTSVLAIEAVAQSAFRETGSHCIGVNDCLNIRNFRGLTVRERFLKLNIWPCRTRAKRVHAMQPVNHAANCVVADAMRAGK